MKQTTINSFLESTIGALIAAPSASILHWFMLELWGNQVSDPIIKSQFVIISWVVFFTHSIIWKFIIRKILVHYNRENLVGRI